MAVGVLRGLVGVLEVRVVGLCMVLVWCVYCEGWMAVGVVCGFGVGVYKKLRLGNFCCRGDLSGGYLLSHLRSTIGVTGLNFSVRDGKRWDPGAITTLMSCFLAHLYREMAVWVDL